jgi:transmembrane sensor
MTHREQVRFEAAQWFLDVRDVENPSPELLLEWMRWMEASDAHRQAFVAVENDWQDAAVVTPAALVAVDDGACDDYDGSVSIAEWRAQVNARRKPEVGARAQRGWRRGSPRWFVAAAAASVALIALLFLAPGQRLFWVLAGGKVHSTGIGQHVEITLEDGSQVNLGARSQLLVRYSHSGRDLQLAGGEAFFSVQKDAGRPFRVHVLNGVVTAVGTAFDVRASSERVVVTVAEGTVQVSSHSSPAQSGDVARIARGESASFVNHPETDSIASLVVTRVDPERMARWRDGWLIYRDEPLRDVVADIRRYTERDVVVAPGVLMNERFTGAVSEDSTVEWLQSLPSVFPLTVKVEGSHIRIAAASGVANASTQ